MSWWNGRHTISNWLGVDRNLDVHQEYTGGQLYEAMQDVYNLRDKLSSEIQTRAEERKRKRKQAPPAAAAPANTEAPRYHTRGKRPRLSCGACAGCMAGNACMMAVYCGACVNCQNVAQWKKPCLYRLKTLKPAYTR